MRILFGIGILLVCPPLLLPAPLTLSFLPSDQTVIVGDSVAVDVMIAGLGSPPAVGAFDLDVSFAAQILTPTDVIFGPFLGDASAAETLTSVTFSPGIMDFAAVSLLPDAILNTLQPETFLLATLLFTASGPGTTPLTLSQVIVDDAFGGKLETTGSGGSVTAIPEPGGWLLLSGGLLVIAAVRRCARSSQVFACRRAE